MYGKNNTEQTQCDVILETIEQEIQPLMAGYYYASQVDKDDIKKVSLFMTNILNKTSSLKSPTFLNWWQKRWDICILVSFHTFLYLRFTLNNVIDVLYLQTFLCHIKSDMCLRSVWLGGGSWSIRRKPTTFRKPMENLDRAGIEHETFMMIGTDYIGIDLDITTMRTQ